MKKAVIITGHFPEQKRRGSILWVSQHLQESGWHITHVTVGYSWLSVLKKDRRLKALGYVPRQGVQKLSPTLTALYGLSPLHPVRVNHDVPDRVLSLCRKLFPAYWAPKLRGPLSEAELVICESGAPVLLAPLLEKYAREAARVYRVNDDIALLNAPDYLIAAELEYRHHFTRISSANPRLLQRFDHPNKTTDPMGIPLRELQKSRPDPYSRKSRHKIAVCAGTTQLDQTALCRIAKLRPHWQIHILGRLKKAPPQDSPNLFFHGEQCFETTLAHIAHADIGLAPYQDVAGVEYQSTNSNRMLLYRYFGLPILGPDRLCDADIPAIIGYSAPDALERCETTQKKPEMIPDWSALAFALSQNGPIVPPTEVAYVPAISV